MYSIADFRRIYDLPDEARVYTRLKHYRLPFNGILIEDVSYVDGEVKEVSILSPFYINKRVKMTFSYSAELSDESILKCHYLMTKFIDMYGADNLIQGEFYGKEAGESYI